MKRPLSVKFNLTSTLLMMLGLHGAADLASADEAFTSSGFARAPEGALDIAHAPAPLFSDPVFDGAADPSVVWNARET